MSKKFLKSVGKFKISFKRAGAALLALALLVPTLKYVAGDGYLRPHSAEQYAETSVKITNMAENSGGSGVILRSDPSESTILTNRHVCKLVEHGGLVIQEDHKYLVAGYKESRQHDLCEIKVNADLHVNTKVAEEAPRKYSKAHISGHPALLPNTVTHGNFSGRMNVNVMVGMRKCTEKDLDDAKEKGDLGKALMCLLAGGLPQFETFDAQLVTATILPGSSGSAVFDDNGEIAGLVFASGSRELAYAIIVPQEYVYSFTSAEAPQMDWSKPDQNAPQTDELQRPSR